jgi:hypothetical protein
MRIVKSLPRIRFLAAAFLSVAALESTSARTYRTTRLAAKHYKF